MTITQGGLETDLRLAAQLEQRLFELLIDRAYLRNWTAGGVPAFAYLGSVNGTMSDTHQLRYWAGGGADKLVSAAEVGTLSVVDPADASVSIAVARHGLKRSISYLAESTGAQDDLNVNKLASDFAASYERRWNDVAAAAVAGASATVGSTGTAFSVDTFYEALYTLEEADNDGPFYCLVGGKQLTDLQRSVRSESGVLEYQPATADMARVKGQGYAGNFAGIEVFKSSQVSDDTTDFTGGMWSAGCFGWKNAQILPTSTTKQIANVAGLMTIEKESIPGEARTELVCNAFFGLSLLEQARIVGIVSRSS